MQAEIVHAPGHHRSQAKAFQDPGSHRLAGAAVAGVVAPARAPQRVGDGARVRGRTRGRALLKLVRAVAACNGTGAVGGGTRCSTDQQECMRQALLVCTMVTGVGFARGQCTQSVLLFARQAQAEPPQPPH